ncbi:MAG: septum formation initiator family protein [Bacillus sp. (in: firmicutes)]
MGSLKDRKVAKIESTYVQQREKSLMQKAKRKVFLRRRLALFGVFACILSGLAVSALFSQSSVIESKTMEKQAVEEKLAKLEKKQQLLEEEIIKLNDDEYIAKIARRDYFLSDEGEVIFNLPNKTEEMD